MTFSIDIQQNSIECHYAECHYAECRKLLKCYAECNYAECRYSECRYSECRSSLNLVSHSDKRSSLFGDDDGKKVFRVSANFFPTIFHGTFY
jgi:hypothetical protein